MQMKVRKVISLEGNGARPSHHGDGYSESKNMYTLNTTEVHAVCYQIRKDKNMVNVGDVIRIDWMEGEPRYEGRVGEVTHIDDAGQLHGTWGGLAVIPGEDEFTVIESK